MDVAVLLFQQKTVCPSHRNELDCADRPSRSGIGEAAPGVCVSIKGAASVSFTIGHDYLRLQSSFSASTSCRPCCPKACVFRKLTCFADMLCVHKPVEKTHLLVYRRLNIVVHRERERLCVSVCVCLRECECICVLEKSYIRL